MDAEISTKYIFCPKCRGTDVESNGNAESEWVAEMEMAATEGYICGSCGHEFYISATYKMTEFNFVNDEYMDDRDIEVE